MPRPISARKRKAGGQPVRILLRKDDTVEVITGRDKGKTGRVLSVDREKGRLLVEGIMMVKRHTRRNPAKQIKGGIAEREAPIAISNVLIVCPQCGPVRMAHQVSPEGRKTRVCRKCGTALDRK